MECAWPLTSAHRAAACPDLQHKWPLFAGHARPRKALHRLAAGHALTGLLSNAQMPLAPPQDALACLTLQPSRGWLIPCMQDTRGNAKQRTERLRAMLADGGAHADLAHTQMPLPLDAQVQVTLLPHLLLAQSLAACSWWNWKPIGLCVAFGFFLRLPMLLCCDCAASASDSAQLASASKSMRA